MDADRWITGTAVAAAVAVTAVLALAGGSNAAKPGGPTATPLYPDVIEAVPDHLQIQNTQQREWLRFTTVHVNIGPGNLQIRGGGQVTACTIDGETFDQCTVATQELLDANGNIVATNPAGVALFHPEHNHWHQSAVAEFQIRRDSPEGPAVAAGTKITFCFVDVEFIGTTGAQKKQRPRTYFECNGELQGLASGWADSYHQSTPLQELDVTGLAPGEYFLTHEADPDNHWLEGPSATSPGEQNNFTWLRFRLARNGANASVTELDHSPCEFPGQCGTGGNP
jgi:Lysyl oxidase